MLSCVVVFDGRVTGVVYTTCLYNNLFIQLVCLYNNWELNWVC